MTIPRDAKIYVAGHSFDIAKSFMLRRSGTLPFHSTPTLQEAALLTRRLEPPKRGHALDKITAIEVCATCRAHHGRFLRSATSTSILKPATTLTTTPAASGSLLQDCGEHSPPAWRLPNHPVGSRCHLDERVS